MGGRSRPRPWWEAYWGLRYGSRLVSYGGWLGDGEYRRWWRACRRALLEALSELYGDDILDGLEEG